MANTVKLKQSSVPGKAPGLGDLSLGELAVNTYDGKLYLKKNVGGSESIIDITAAGGATVTSVGLSLPSIFAVSGSPVTASGTLTGALATQAANKVFAGPTTGSGAAPTFRALVAADIPDGLIFDQGTF